MIQWKQRLYAFLLRRLLGPFLDASSTKKLHDSIDFSLHEGRFTLKDVGLSADHLTKILSSSSCNLSIRRARIECLEIYLTLRENDYNTSDPENSAPQSSLAWRAMKLGTSNSKLPAVSLIAEIKIDGVYLELEPNNVNAQRPTSPRLQDESKNSAAASSQSVIGSYVDAALNSLQLTLKISNLNVKLCSERSPKSLESWVEVRLGSASYRDLETPSTTNAPSDDKKTVLNKSLEFSGLNIKAGEVILEKCTGDDSSVATYTSQNVSTLVLAQGTGHVYIRVVECTDDSSSGKAPRQSDTEPSIQHDIEVKLNQQLNLSIDRASILQLRSVAQAFSRELDYELGEAQIPPDESLPGDAYGGDEQIDQEDLKALTGIMKQYQEAYHSAERNELRGGILVPTNAYEDGAELEEEENGTFDIFFDANDQSFMHYKSVLIESIMIPELEELNDFVHTKLRLHLLSGCFKVVFTDPNRRASFRRPEEYMLLTFDDLNVSSSLSARISEHSLSISHFEIEDAQLDTTHANAGYVSLGGIPQSEGRVEIGNVLRFTSEIPEDDDSMENAVVSQAPCVTLHVKLSRNSVLESVFECDTTFAPIEIIYRHGTMSNLKALVDQIGEGSMESESDAPDPQLVVGRGERKCQVRCSCSCPAITFSIPILENVSTDALFERCGEVLEHAPVRESSLGILFEQISIEWNDGQDDTGEASCRDSGVKFACHHILVFASSPIDGKLAVDTKMQRTDLLVARGRMEVEPYIPISIDMRDNSSDGQEINHGRESFPIVPAISSFKARQEDEDEELHIDQVLFSKLHDVDADSRKGLRGNDPQASMLADAELSRLVVSIIVPEVTGDLTKIEMDVLLRMAQAATPSSKKAASHPGKVSDTKESDNRLSVSVNFHQMSLTLHGDSFFQKSDQYSYVLMMDQFKFHSHLMGSKMKHIRLLCHDASFYEACGPASSFAVQKAEQSIHNRVNFVRERSLSRSNPSAVPIVYRSHLFVPISRERPSFLLDLIDLTPVASLHSQKKVHLTLYHLTYRYDVDAKWMDRLSTIFKEPKTEVDGEATIASSNPTPDADGSSSLTRIFVSLADCNLDYTSAGYFNTVSRSIVRLGDFRLSSNIMRPTGLVQAYSVSLGDLTFYLCNRRYPHQRENSRLCRAKYLMDPADCYNDMREPVVSVYTPETLLREIGFTNVLSLDSLDAIVAMPTVGTMEHKKSPEDPHITTSLTLGLLSLHACKDSFGCFTGTIGELQAKLTALSDADLATLQRQTRSARSASQATPIVFQREDTSKHENTVEDETEGEGKIEDGEIKDRQYSPILSHFNGPEGSIALGPIMDEATLHTRNGETKPFLLDGYDWTTVDHDPLPEPEIPPGDEQVAVWYSQPAGIGTKKDDNVGGDYGTFPGRIIPQHFPLHQVSDPLAEGDMGAAKYAGAGFAPKVKSRIIVHDLTMKLRFFDGYDWPDMLSLAKREVARDAKNSIIESNTQRVNKDKDKMARNLAAQPDFANAGLERKAKLMGDLLLEKGETESSTFDDVPLPEERGAKLERQAELRRLSRKTHRFFQVSANGLRLRMDTFQELDTHRLRSIMDLTISDLFLAETVSRTNPVKMVGEWVNENEHPRDTRHGTVMFKMVSWQPAEKVTGENEIANDVAEVTMQLLPMRCIIDQSSISFIRAFFDSGEEDDKKEDWTTELHLVPPPRLRLFRVKQWKVKVDYIPKTIDFSALREGSFVELVNLNPIDGMVITLQQVNAKNEIGFGAVFGSLFRSWVQDICATQLLKFLTHARPFEPIVSVGSGMADLVVLPYEAFKNGENISRALRSGISSLAGTVAFETLTTTSRLTQFAANQMAQMVGGSSIQARAQLFAALPSRPLETPRGMADVSGHALQSLTQGLQAANYKVVIVPYREFSRNGTTGAVKSVLRGIPVLLLAPLTGATEALSYTLLGARNSLRPDIRREEENILRSSTP